MEDNLAVLFRQINMYHRNMVQAYLDALGLYVGQPRFLFALSSNPGMTQGEITQLLNVSKETISVSVKRLEQAGYIKRELSSRDKRIRLLYLTEKGKALMPELTEHFKVINEHMFSRLNDEEKVCLENIYKKMLDGLKEGSFD